MSAHQKLAAAFATTLALSAVSAAQLGNAQPGGAGQDGDIVLVDRTCFLNATVEGTWNAPTDETGRLLGTMYNSQGEPLFRLDAEISRYIFQQVDGVPGEEVDAGGIMGSAYALTGAEVELHVQGEWLRRAGEAGSFGLTLFVIGDHIPLIAVGAMQGEFLPAGEPSDPPQEGPFIMEPDRKDLPRVPYGDDLRGPVRDGAVATGGLGLGGSIDATAAGAKNLGSARGIDLPGEQHDSVVGAKKLGAAWSLSEVELNPPASLDDDVVDTREVGGARSLDETSIDEPPFRMPGSGINAPRQGGTISATVSGASTAGSAQGFDLPGENDAVAGARKLGGARDLGDGTLVHAPLKSGAFLGHWELCMGG